MYYRGGARHLREIVSMTSHKKNNSTSYKPAIISNSKLSKVRTA